MKLYVGLLPPLVALAVKVTLAPAQAVVPPAELMVTDGVTGVVMVIVIPVLLTDEGYAQTALLVRSHVTTSLLFSVELV